MRLQKRRVLTSGVLGLGAALALAGCGAGQITQTDTMLPAVNGALAQAGPISLRNAGLENTDKCEQAYAPGSTAPLTLTIANASGQDDELLSVTSPNATGATIQGQKVIVGGSTLVIGKGSAAESGAIAQGTTPSSSASPTSSASPSSSASSSPSSSASSSSTSPTPVGQAGTIGHATIELQGIKTVVWPGQTTPVTFVFRNAGPITVQLPIAAPTQVLSCQPQPTQTGEGH
ncbi:copper(I)-binding protein [Amycolatopsis bartoniae]|uniref:Copper chaperone PCu(A)C n=1 Tax=Amycolatopsis bartoniae TaxID=941986 RepID=A0A8H9MCT2_9PSEU|nr:hypothetical protein [Amycolatopsis bartoniae]MBB2935096.1 copper(I)-binding protein [Amycolatopsis bartoniae]TVT06977.1 hypothetical protein FNH07_17700 [Amycolatopsis bartoniae]GHF74322.1 hypothetical protein GCM10017566_55140 [Amycolatopsis bartoniae]